MEKGKNYIKNTFGINLGVDTRFNQLDQIDYNIVHSYIESKNFKEIINNYLLNRENSTEKRKAILSHISNYFDSILFNLNDNTDIKYLSFDLDFLYYALPHLSKQFPVFEVYELHYLFKKILIVNYKQLQTADSSSLRIIFFDEGNFEFEEETIYFPEIISIDCNILIDKEFCYEFCKRKSLLILDHDHKGRVVQIEELNSILKFTSKDINSDLNLFINLIKDEYLYVKHISEKLQKNEVLFEFSVIEWKKWNSDFIFWPFFGPFIEDINPFSFFNLKEDKKCALKALNIAPKLLKYVSENLKNDKEVVLTTIKQRGYYLEFASEYLKDDKDIALIAVTTDHDAMEYISKRLKEDKKFILEALARNGNVLDCVSMEFKNDKDIVLAAVRSNGNAIRYASENLKNDPLIIETANNNPNNSDPYPF
jgi:hypothetical protein